MVVKHHREGVELPLVELTNLGDPLLLWVITNSAQF